ncbi:MAG: PGF-CTERM sorting domain-containing protein [Halobacteriales archaeon]
MFTGDRHPRWRRAPVRDYNRHYDDTGTPSQETPGFGIGAAIAGIGGAGYMLKRRLDATDDEQ